MTSAVFLFSSLNFISSIKEQMSRNVNVILLFIRVMRDLMIRRCFNFYFLSRSVLDCFLISSVCSVILTRCGSIQHIVAQFDISKINLLKGITSIQKKTSFFIYFSNGNIFFQSKICCFLKGNYFVFCRHIAKIK